LRVERAPEGVRGRVVVTGGAGWGRLSLMLSQESQTSLIMAAGFDVFACFFACLLISGRRRACRSVGLAIANSSLTICYPTVKRVKFIVRLLTARQLASIACTGKF
jgi:hypothetical protein